MSSTNTPPAHSAPRRPNAFTGRRPRAWFTVPGTTTKIGRVDPRKTVSSPQGHGQMVELHIEKRGSTKVYSLMRLADAAGVHRSNVSRILHGRHTPRLDTALRLAEQLGLSPDEFAAYLSHIKVKGRKAAAGK